jgi:hypothetical protein
MAMTGESCVWHRVKIDAIFRDLTTPPSERIERDVHDPV